MATKSKAVFTNLETRTFIQDDGIGTAFTLYDCQAMASWSKSYGETIRVKVKSPHEYGKMVTKKTIPGAAEAVTFPINAYTPEGLDWLLDIECPIDFQLHFGICSSPSDATGYKKIRHFYQASRTEEGEDSVDYLGEETPSGIVQTVNFSADDMITIVQVEVERKRSGVTETQAFNGVGFLLGSRCEGDCGKAVDECQWGAAVADSSYGVSTANVWYTDDSGATWTLCAVDPFEDTNAHCSDVILLPGETAPRIVVFRGNVSGTYGARCSISDDWGATWSEVDMGGTTFVHRVLRAFAFGPGLIFAVGSDGYVYKSEDRCASWTEIDSDTTGTIKDLWDIHTPDGINVCAVGSDNTIIFSDDGADSWTTKTGPADGTENLYAVTVDSKWIIWCGGEVDASEECLWSSQDQGDTWTAETFTGSTTDDGVVRGLRPAPRAPKQHKVWIHGTNDGATERWGPGTNFYFHRTLDGGGTSERPAVVANAGLNDLEVCNINMAWAVGEVTTLLGDIQNMNPV